MTTGLPISDVVDVQVNLTPVAAQERNFGNLLVVGDSDIIDVIERLRVYTSSDQVANDFGGQAPEYLAAQLYFAQNPQPEECYIARWASTNTHGTLRGGILSPAQQAIGNFNNVNNGSLSIVIDAVQHILTNMDFTAQVNLNGVAAILQTAMTGFGTIRWDSNNNRFVLESATSGQLSTVSFASLANSGTDMSAALGVAANSGGYPVAGINAESVTTAVAALADKSTDWYGVTVAANAVPGAVDYLALSTFIESASPSRVHGVTTQDPSTLDPSVTNDLASQLQDAGFNRTFAAYSSSNPYVAASIFGRAFTVDFDSTDTTITLNFKQLPGVAPEQITESQKQALIGKNCNVYLKYNNNTAILQSGAMASGQWFDAVHGTDWLQNEIQTNVWNLFLTTGTKIAQTDAGLNQIMTAVSQAMEQGVSNGLLYKGGVWEGPPIGSVLNSGDTLAKGYLVFAPKVATQNQAARAARKTPLIQAPCKLAGAFHSSNVLVSVNQ